MALLQYKIEVAGLSAIDSAFASIEQKATALNQRLRAVANDSRSAVRDLGAKGPRGAADTGARAGNADIEEAARWKQVQRDMTAALRAEKRQQTQASREAARADTAAAKEEAGRWKQVQRDMTAALRAEKQQQTQAAREAARAAVAAKREEAAEAKRLDRDIQTSYREAVRSQAREDRLAQQNARRAQMLGARAEAQAESVTARRVGAVTGVLGRTAGTVGSVVGGGLAAAGLGGGALFATAVHETMGTMAAASKLASQFSTESTTPEQLAAKKRELVAEASGVEGYTRQEALEAVSLYHEKTGSELSARRMVKKLGGLSLATSTDIRDMASFAATVHNKFVQTGRSDAEAEGLTEGILRNAAAQAKEKSIEIKNFAAVGGSVVAQTSFLSGDAGQNAKKLIALTQLSPGGGADSAAEAATSVQNFIGDIVKHQKNIKKVMAARGIGGADKLIVGGKIDLGATLAAVLEATKGDVDKAMKVFNVRGLRAFMPLGDIYQAAEKRQKGTGRAAVEKEIDRLSGLTVSDRAIKMNVASRMADPDIQIKMAHARLNEAIGKELVPALTQLVPHLAAAAPALGQFAAGMASVIKWLASNPWQGLGVLVAGALTKEIASAAIGSAVTSALERVLRPGVGSLPSVGGAGAPVAAPGAAPAATGGGFLGGATAGGVASAIGTGALLGAGAYVAIDQAGKAATDTARKSGKEVIAGINDLLATGGEYDQPVKGETAKQKSEREQRSQYMGARRTRIALAATDKAIAEQEKQREANRGGVMGWVESATNALLSDAGAGVLAVPGAGLAFAGARQLARATIGTSVDLTGTAAIDENLQNLAARRNFIMEGGAMTAAPTLAGYSSEREEQGYKPLGESAKQLNEVADRLKEAAEAHKNAATATNEAAKSLGTSGAGRPVIPTPGGK